MLRGGRRCWRLTAVSALRAPGGSVSGRGVVGGQDVGLGGKVREADRAGHPVGAVVAVAAGVLVQIGLVVVLGQVVGAAELSRRVRGILDGGDAGSQAQAGQLALEGLSDPRGRLVLGGRRRPHRRAVLGADVVAVTVQVRGVVVLPECLEQGVPSLSADGRVVDDAHRLSVTGRPGAHLLVRGIGCLAAHVAHRRRDDAVLAPQDPLHPPEAAGRQVDDPTALGPRPVQGRLQHRVVSGGGQDRRLAAGRRRSAERVTKGVEHEDTVLREVPIPARASLTARSGRGGGSGAGVGQALGEGSGPEPFSSRRVKARSRQSRKLWNLPVSKA